MPYLKDISAILGLSVSTVSKAIMGYPDISDETRRMVLRTAAEINYKPKKRAHDWSDQDKREQEYLNRDRADIEGAAQEGDAGRAAGAIGFLAPGIGKLLESAFYKEMLCAMAAETARFNYDLVIIGTKMPDISADGSRMAATDKLKGFCLLAGNAQQTGREYADLSGSGIPLVIIDQDAADSPDEVGRAAVRKLMDTIEHPDSKNGDS